MELVWENFNYDEFVYIDLKDSNEEIIKYIDYLGIFTFGMLITVFICSMKSNPQHDNETTYSLVENKNLKK